MNSELAARLINCLRRDLQTVFLPELQSDRARTMAAMMDYLLRHYLCGATNPISDDPNVERRLLKEQQEREANVPSLERSPERQALFQVTPEKIAAYLALRRPDWKSPRVSDLRQVLGGFSKETFLLDVSHAGGEEGLVLRRDLESGPVETEASFEFELVLALHEIGFLVAEPLWLESDVTILGRPFQVSRKVKGAVLNGTVQLQSGAEQAGACRLLAHVLARLHSIDPGTLHLSGWDATVSAREYVRRYIAFWERRWQDRCLEDSAILRDNFSWLKANIPDDLGSAVLVHGDAGLQNLMIENGSATALIDWELAHFGHPAEDLNYARMWVEAALPWDEFLNIYQTAGGRPYNPKHSKFFRVLNSVRNAVTCVMALHGFGRDEQPQLASAYAGVHFYRMFSVKAQDDLREEIDV